MSVDQRVPVGRDARAHRALELTALLGGLAGLVWIGRGVVLAVGRLVWRWADLGAAGSLLADLVAAHPVRAGACLVVGVGAALAVEFRRTFFRRILVSAWLIAGLTATVVYGLSAFGVAHAWVIQTVVAVAAAAAVSRIVLSGSASLSRDRVEFAARSTRERIRRAAPAALIGVIAAVVLFRASLEVVTEWDAIVYHASFARDWEQSLPSLAHAVGPSVGAELSYNYPALFPAVGVAFGKGLGVSAIDALRFVSPLAFLSLLCLLRIVGGPRRSPLGWLAPAILLGCAFPVSYAAWPTSYELLTLFMSLAVVELALWARTSSPPWLGFAFLGLAAACGVIGIVFAGLVAAAWLARTRGRPLVVRRLLATAGRIVSASCLVVAPTACVVAASVRSTHSLFFPWVTYPGGSNLLPPTYWKAARDEIVNNSYGQFGAHAGDFAGPFRGIIGSPLLFPGGLLVALLTSALLSVAAFRHRRETAAPIAVAATIGTIAAFVVGQLVWLRYFVPFSVVAAALLGRSLALLATRSRAPLRGGAHVVLGMASAVAAACCCFGLALAIAGPNVLQTFTAVTDFRTQEVTAFAPAAAVTSTKSRLRSVFGGDAQAWADINRLTDAGLRVATFDIRNYYLPYRPSLQLDGLAGASIRATSRGAVVAELRRRRIDMIFVPSWFWDPGPSADPLVTKSPVLSWVGARGLAPLKVYLPNESTLTPSLLYWVGPRDDRFRRAAASLGDLASIAFAAPPAARTAAGGTNIAFEGPIGGSAGAFRIAATAGTSAGARIRLLTEGLGRTGLTVLEPVQPSAFPPARVVDCSRAGPAHRLEVTDIVFPGAPRGFSLLDLWYRHRQRVKGRIQILPQQDSGVLVRSCGDPTTRQGGVFPPGSIDARIIGVGLTGPAALTFEYHDDGRDIVSFNGFDVARSLWSYDVAQIERCGTGKWRTGHIPLPAAVAGSVELGPFVRNRGLEIRNLRLESSPSAASGEITILDCQAHPLPDSAVFAPRSSSSRINVVGLRSGRWALAFRYRDDAQDVVSFNAYDNARGRWTYDAGQLQRCGTGRWLDGRLVLSGANGRAELGPAVRHTPLSLRDIRLVQAPSVTAPTVTVLDCGTATVPGSAVFRAGLDSSRIDIADLGRGDFSLRFQYLGAGRQPFSFNRYDQVRGRWIYGSARLARCGTGRWLEGQIPLPAAATTVELAPVVGRHDVTVRHLRVVPGITAPQPTIGATCSR